MDEYNALRCLAILFMLPVIYWLNSLNPYQLQLLKIGLVTTFVVGIIGLIYIELTLWGPRRYKKALLELEEHKKDAILKIHRMKEDLGFALNFEESIEAIKKIEDPKFSIQVDDLKDDVNRVVKRFLCENTPDKELSLVENLINGSIAVVSSSLWQILGDSN